MVDFFEAIEALKKPVSETPKKLTGPVQNNSPVQKRDEQIPLFNKSRDSVFLFTYGTLKRKNIRHYILKDSEFICEAYLERNYYLMQTDSSPGLMYPARGYPIAFKKDGNQELGRRIRGEIFRVPFDSLKYIDSIENVGTMYTKEKLPAHRIVEDGGKTTAELYHCFVYIGIKDYWKNSGLCPAPTFEQPIPNYTFNPYSLTARSLPDVG